jgi:hypothetical protein
MIAAIAVSDRAPKLPSWAGSARLFSHTCLPNAGSFKPELGGVKTMPSASTTI